MGSKRFDPEEITNRKLQKLTAYDKWSNIEPNGAMEQMVKAEAESEAEIARYGEYLLKELKWDTSGNFSSVKHMAKLVGKKTNRMESAVGTLVFSHTDNNGGNRMKNLGKTIFDIDGLSDYDELTLDTTVKGVATKALVPWTSDLLYSIPTHTVVNSSDGIPFVVAKTCTIKQCSSPRSAIFNSTQSYENFIASGGYSDMKYLLVPVVQGVEKAVSFGNSSGYASQNFMLDTLNIEAGSSYYTKQFLYAEVEGDVEKWTEVSHLSKAGAKDKVFQIDISDDQLGTVITFGDGTCGMIPPKDKAITFHYLETLGAAGNITKNYTMNPSVVFPGGQAPIDPRNTGASEFITCQNIQPIIGGKDLETFAEYKDNAEKVSVANCDIIHTIGALEEEVNKISPFTLMRTKAKKVLTKSTLKGSASNGNTADVDIYVNSIGVTGLSYASLPLSTREAQLFDSIVSSCITDSVLANSKISYVQPNLIHIKEYINLEKRNMPVDVDAYEKSIEQYVLQSRGPVTEQVNPGYSQSDIVKLLLDHDPDITAISTVDYLCGTNLELINTESNGSQGDENNGEGDYVCLKVSLSGLNANVLDKQGNICKCLSSGHEVVAIVNLKFRTYDFTFAIVETTNQATAIQNLIESDTYENRQLTIAFDSTARESVKYQAYQFDKSNDVAILSLNELQSFKKDREPTIDMSQWLLLFEPNPSGAECYIGIPLNECKEMLGASMRSSKVEIESSVKSGILGNAILAELMLVPEDKTIGFNDWNAISYVNEVKCKLDN